MACALATLPPSGTIATRPVIVAQRRDHRRAVGLILHQLPAGFGPLQRHFLDGRSGLWKAQAVAYLVEKVAVGALHAPHAAGHVIGGLQILEGQIPGFTCCGYYYEGLGSRSRKDCCGIAALRLIRS